MRAQLGIEDVILRGLGMFPNKQKCARVCTRALLANLRHRLYEETKSDEFVREKAKAQSLIYENIRKETKIWITRQ